MSANPPTVNPWMILPFGVLLAAIALGPLLFPKWWLRHYAKPVFALALITLGYYFFGLGAFARVGHMVHEYFSFIALVGSLYIISGGIHINVKGEATPFVNVVFLLTGALLANVLGNTGASMLLIRPWLRMNKYRVTGDHVVFFIFIISNVGGCIMPLGPPLIIGYLMGVPFGWVMQHCYPMFLVGVGVLLAIFYVVDTLNYRRAPKEIREHLTGQHDQWRFEGLGNLGFLGIILASIFINQPAFLREGLMIAAAIGSYFSTSKQVHDANHFDFHPIEEVAVLFIGIFATMLPALDWLEANAGHLQGIGLTGMYWASGCLSSALDNAPTYICFLKAISVQYSSPDFVAAVNHLVQNHGAGLSQISGPNAAQIRQTFLLLQKYHPNELVAGKLGAEQIAIARLLGDPSGTRALLAISIGSVFFGANTYIGNGPNFMVKSMADHQKIRTPGFLSYLWRFTIPYMLPTLLIVWWLFFRP